MGTTTNGVGGRLFRQLEKTRKFDAGTELFSWPERVEVDARGQVTETLRERQTVRNIWPARGFASQV